MRVKRQARTGSTRALLICAALACLCASDGVGPRLLPYPTLPQTQAAGHAGGPKETSRQSLPDADQNESGETDKAGQSSSKLPVFSAQGLSVARPAVSARKVGERGTPFRPAAPASLRVGRAPPPNA